MPDIEASVVQLARLTLEGRQQEVLALLRRTMATLRRSRPDLRESIKEVTALLHTSPVRSTSQRPLPVDSDSRLELLRRETIANLEPEPVWPPQVLRSLESIVSERRRLDELAEVGIAPSRSLLFVGKPGVGKTLAARWLAFHLDRQLLTLDLAAVMSSYLGRTGNNIRTVLDYARHHPSVLLLDEFDAIAKRRDDVTEIGELKRLVTVLLQAVDEWPEDGLLIAATNHHELLDPAVWRRFDHLIEFPMPTPQQASELVARLLPQAVPPAVSHCLGASVSGKSFAEIEKTVQGAWRRAILDRTPLAHAMLDTAASLSREAPLGRRLEIAQTLYSLGKNQREIHELTGLARDTLRKHRIAVQAGRT